MPSRTLFWSPAPIRSGSIATVARFSQARRSGGKARKGGETAGGVDANASKSHLYEVAKKLGISGRSRMDKGELVEAIQKANERETRKSRS